MATLGFTAMDFAVFKIEDFNQRMQQIDAHVRPKLIKLGRELVPELRRKTQMEFFPHVAKHARRIVNPPPETWVAFGPSPRGYKHYGYLALCISAAGVHARAVVKSEADHRPTMASSLTSRAPQLVKEFRGTKISRYDKWDFAHLPDGEAAGLEFFTTLADGLAKKTGGLDLGFGWDLRESLRLDRAELLEAFRELAPLYRLLRTAA